MLQMIADASCDHEGAEKDAEPEPARSKVIHLADYLPKPDLSFNGLCTPLLGEMIGYARRLCDGDFARADDIVQSAYLKAFQAWDRWNSDGIVPTEIAARAWMYRIVTNTFFKACRRHKNDVRRNATWHEDIAHATHATQDATLRTLIGGTVGDEVLAALGALPHDRRRIIELYFIEELDCGAIAKKLGIPESTVWTRKMRACDQLMKRLRKYARANYGLECKADAHEGRQARARRADAVGSPLRGETERALEAA